MGNNNDKNEIVAEININEYNINKEIKIINSFEQYLREKYLNKNGFTNENEIKKCKIKINNKIIPFLISINLIKKENIL